MLTLRFSVNSFWGVYNALDSVISSPYALMDSANRAQIRSRFDRWKMESFSNNNRHLNDHNDRRRSGSSNRSNTSARSDIKTGGDNFSGSFHGYHKYSALWNRTAKCIVCVSCIKFNDYFRLVVCLL